MHRVLHVVGVRWWSAIAAYAVDLAEAQRCAGDHVSIAVLEGTPAAREATARGLQVCHAFGPNAWDQHGLRRALAAEIRDAGLDVLHVHTGVGHLAAELARRATNVALVRTRGDVRAPRAAPWSRWLYRRADAVVLSGSFLRDTLAPFDLPDERTAVVLGGVDTVRFAPDALGDRRAARRRLSIPDGAFVAGMAGRLSPVKGHAHAIRALGREETAGVHLLVSGEAAQLDRESLLVEARALGVAARVHVVDRREDVREIFAASDVGLVASLGSEAICRVAGEMMASGLPVIASSVSALPDMIDDGVEGLLVPPGDPGAIAHAVSRLATDAGRRAAMGRAARVRACGELAREIVAARYREIYRGAIARRS